VGFLSAAIIAAGATAGRAVVLSGLTVAVGLVTLIVLPVPFLRSVGYGGMLIPLVALVAALTLLPVTLAAWGPRLDRHRIHRAGTTFSAAGRPGRASWCAAAGSPASPDWRSSSRSPSRPCR
jgi:RND superfamily putative drug exporter